MIPRRPSSPEPEKPPPEFEDNTDFGVFDDLPYHDENLRGILKAENAPRKNMHIQFVENFIQKSDETMRRREDRIFQHYIGANDSPVFHLEEFGTEPVPKPVVVPFKMRPMVTDLEVHAASLAYSSFLSDAAKSIDISQRMNNFLIFMHYYFGSLRSFGEIRKPMRSFVGETYDVDQVERYGIKAIFEQIKGDTIVMNVTGNGWSLTQQVVTRSNGTGFKGAGTFKVGNEEIGFSFKVTLALFHIVEVDKRYLWFLIGSLDASVSTSNFMGKLIFDDCEGKVVGFGRYPLQCARHFFKGKFAGKGIVLLERKMKDDGTLFTSEMSELHPLEPFDLADFKSDMSNQDTTNLQPTDSRFRKDIELKGRGDVENAEKLYHSLCQKNMTAREKLPQYFNVRCYNNLKYYEVKEDKIDQTVCEQKNHDAQIPHKRPRLN